MNYEWNSLITWHCCFMNIKALELTRSESQNDQFYKLDKTDNENGKKERDRKKHRAE